jgi:hypothetical protein
MATGGDQRAARAELEADSEAAFTVVPAALGDSFDRDDVNVLVGCALAVADLYRELQGALPQQSQIMAPREGLPPALTEALWRVAVAAYQLSDERGGSFAQRWSTVQNVVQGALREELMSF